MRARAVTEARRATTPVRVVRVGSGAPVARPDTVVTEEPLQIRAQGPAQAPTNVAVTMRTPGSDFELAAGFLYTEGLIDRGDEIAAVKYCDLPEELDQQFNIVTVCLHRPWLPLTGTRSFAATASCGICGKASIEQVEVDCAPLPTRPPVAATVIASLPDRLRDGQRLFRQTGGLHAAGLFSPNAETRCLREDVGRHNAVDKVVGHALLAGRLPLHDDVLAVSGRLSFEIIQKAARAGIALVAAVSAPSSLAVTAAERLGVTIAAFVREGSFNIYSHPERIDISS